MKTATLVLLHVALVASCAAPDPSSSVAGSFADPVNSRILHQHVPNHILKALPSRLNRLSPRQQLTLIEFLDHTGLRPYSSNIELTRNGYCMFLNEKRTLVIFDGGRAISRRDVAKHLATDPALRLPNVPGGDDACVSGCILMGEDSSVLLKRTFDESTLEQSTTVNMNQSAEPWQATADNPLASLRSGRRLPPRLHFEGSPMNSIDMPPRQ